MIAPNVFRERPPFHYYGCKHNIARVIWSRLGAVQHYIEPFAGSAAVLLSRPGQPGDEILGDVCGFVSNFWRAAKWFPQDVARHAHFLPSQIDLHARHAWIVRRALELDLKAKLQADPAWCDPKLAAWWAWGASLWVGSGWCNLPSEQRPHVHSGLHQHVPAKKPNVQRGRGLHRKFTTVADYLEDLIQRVESGSPSTWEEDLQNYFKALACRLERVTLFHGDWQSCVTTGILRRDRERGHSTGVFLDPPYDQDMRDKSLYTEDRPGLSREVWKWAVEHGDDPGLRIALCGLEGEHRMPPAWEVLRWKNQGGPRGGKDKERIWFSPHCLRQGRQCA